MLAREFKNFYKPYFYGKDLQAIPVQDASLEQAKSCEFLAKFDHSYVEDLPLIELVEKHIAELPKNFTFVSTGPDADPADRYLRPIISKIRSDIRYITPDDDMTEEWIDRSVNQYFSPNPFITHTLKTIDRLVSEGIPCGRLGPGIRGQRLLNKWVIQDLYDTVPMYLYGLEHEDMVVPNFLLPFSKAFLKDIQLPNCRYKTSQIGPILLMIVLRNDISIAQAAFADGDDWNWYPQLLNRYWQQPSYYTLESFL